jgi:hypothetical protein
MAVDDTETMARPNFESRNRSWGLMLDAEEKKNYEEKHRRERNGTRAERFLLVGSQEMPAHPSCTGRFERG